MKKFLSYSAVFSVGSALLATVAFAAEAEEKMGFGERVLFALQVTGVGMVAIFAVLALLMGVLGISKYFFYTKSQKKTPTTPSQPEPEVLAQSEEISQQEPDQGELIAVITAAVSVALADSTPANTGFRVVSFRRASGKNAWNQH